MIVIIDYFAGNLTSVKRGLDYLKIPCEITSDKTRIKKSMGIIFPGVGAAGSAMRNLREQGLDDVLKEEVERGKPLLGICLGCQIVLDYSEENNTPCLGLIPGRCVRFSEGLEDEWGKRINIPHMGWNQVNIIKKNPLFQGVPQDSNFYFVHSYYPSPEDAFVLGKTRYGIEFCSVMGRDGLWALQFHPEKSGRIGLTILKNFYNYCKEV